ncbi:MAG: S9 family peptidase [Gammaproteobacteria bacterium]|nr:S9 family peptidase [Gammaproteobacteria bacterium]
MTRLLCLALALLSCASFSLAADAPPAIAAALQALESVHALTEVALSPDGRQLVYGTSLTGSRGGNEVEVSALFLADAHDGSHVVRLTACPGTACDEHSVAWSPDGTRIAFVTTDASEQPQLALANASGGAVHTLTEAHGPLDTPRWSPDGKRLGFLYAVGAPRTPGPLHPLARDAGVLTETVYEQRLAVIAAGGGEPALLGPADLNIYEYDWSPDGRRFVVSAAHGSGDDNWWLAELYLLDAHSGTLTPLVKPALQIASPRWSGDGRRIAYISGIMSDEGITGGDVYVLPVSSGTPVNVTPGLKISVQTITWNGSSKDLIATGFAAGEGVLATIDVDAKSQQELWRAPQMIWSNTLAGLTPGDAGVALSRDGRFSAVIRQSYTSPPEVETGPPGQWKPITRLNQAVRPLTGKASNIHWRSDNFDVQGMLIAPPSVTPGAKYPLVVKIHGGPAHAHYPLFPASPDSYDAVLANQGYFVFKPNPRGSYGQGEAFAQANVKDFGYGDLRDVLSGIDAVERSAPVDPARVGICGWSYGGYMTMWALTQTDRFKAAVAGAGLSDWLSYYGTNNIDTWMIPYFGASVYDDPKVYERSSPITFIRKVRTPTLLVAGDRDAEVPITQSYEYWNALRRFGVKTEFVVYPDEGHDFFKRSDQIDVMERIVGWFNAYLKPSG